jgi:hypothetical protein
MRKKRGLRGYLLRFTHSIYHIDHTHMRVSDSKPFAFTLKFCISDKKYA